MKSIIVAACMLLTPQLVMAEEVKLPLVKVPTVKTVCIKGYEFAVIVSSRGYNDHRSVAITQIFTESTVPARWPQPMKCHNAN